MEYDWNNMIADIILNIINQISMLFRFYFRLYVFRVMKKFQANNGNEQWKKNIKKLIGRIISIQNVLDLIQKSQLKQWFMGKKDIKKMIL